ncbi:MAG: phosphomannomutase/phosphoglucomutase [Wolbachia endosymbiont of Menacanthus eurysternus]|nr:MAG: phosphomannomutase/phosphoglucomutase [Wolbachia endosymbiont of Menacanthus eurysternus]
MDNTIIKKYDIKGIVGKDLQIRDGYEIGRKFGQIINNVCVGYDNRITSPKIEKELIKGLTLSGANVTRIGLCSLPMLYIATQIVNADLGIMITALHNPNEYNGFNFFFNCKKTYSNQKIKEIINTPIKIGTKIGNTININIYSEYINVLKSALKNNSTRKLKIAWDSKNSSVNGIMRYLEKILPDHIHIVINNNSIDRTFPCNEPNSIKEKNLTQLINIIKKNKCDFGIAFNGDGNKICLIDNKGNIISNDHLFMIFVREILEEYPGCKIIANIKMNIKVYNFVKKLGGKIITSSTEDSLIMKKIIEENAKFAGEPNGHFFFLELGFDDGLYSAIKFVDILLKKNLSLSEIIKDLPKLSTAANYKV